MGKCLILLMSSLKVVTKTLKYYTRLLFIAGGNYQKSTNRKDENGSLCMWTY